MTEYLYKKAGFDTGIFSKEIMSKSYAAALSHVTTDDDQVAITFTRELTSEETADLDAVIAGHPNAKWKLTEHLDEYRWTREVSGITSQGYEIDTADRSKTLINGAYSMVLAANTPEATMSFKTKTGWQTLTHATVEQIALDVADHVRKCFDAEKIVTDQIWNETLTNEASVEAEFETQYQTV